MADVVVIGSGASGGMAAYNLTQKGVKVLLLDAGEEFDRRYFWTHTLPYQADARLRKGDEPPRFFLDKKEQPYLTPEGKPFDLMRVWGRGGKTNVWGRVSLRMSDLDFAAAERDGWGIPWPIRYADIAPYYDKAEQLMGVCGGTDDSDVLPGSKVLMPAPAPRCGEVFLRKACDKLRIPIVAGRRANFTRPHRGFAPCHYCGACGQGCDTASFFSSADHLIPQALETGNLEIQPNAVVARILVDANGRASGVQYFDRKTGAERQVKARVVVLGASAMDSTRILLNSKSERFPNGLGNGSDQLGRNFCEQMMVHVRGFLPQLTAAATRTTTASAASTSTCRASTIGPTVPSPTTCAASGCNSGTRDHRRPAPTSRSTFPASARRSRRRSRSATRRSSRCIPSARCCRGRRAASPWTRAGATATACRS